MDGCVSLLLTCELDSWQASQWTPRGSSMEVSGLGVLAKVRAPIIATIKM